MVIVITILFGALGLFNLFVGFVQASLVKKMYIIRLGEPMPFVSEEEINATISVSSQP
ncbi:hypothetical protein [Pinibacter aurantiacus]|uniref:Uncharacterized protein n=1 Tax=Pinibacter aurantiacus TaxID=2851599 RepID=A0A9E2W6Y6_9BACT|nr:hypothetical protein [Pinibacter aurantiacus]MBV4360378.1 hypothetical protein [Pinibacter aurantiacus]